MHRPLPPNRLLITRALFPAYSQVKPYLSIGYTSASERLAALENFAKKGSGISIDAVYNLKHKPKTTYYKTSSDVKIPTDMAVYSIGGAPYSGPYLSGTIINFRLETTLFMGLGNSD